MKISKILSLVLLISISVFANSLEYDVYTQNKLEDLKTSDLLQLKQTANKKDKKKIDDIINSRKLNLTKQEREKLMLEKEHLKKNEILISN